MPQLPTREPGEESPPDALEWLDALGWGNSLGRRDILEWLLRRGALEKRDILALRDALEWRNTPEWPRRRAALRQQLGGAGKTPQGSRGKAPPGFPAWAQGAPAAHVELPKAGDGMEVRGIVESPFSAPREEATAGVVLLALAAIAASYLVGRTTPLDSLAADGSAAPGRGTGGCPCTTCTLPQPEQPPLFARAGMPAAPQPVLPPSPLPARLGR